MPRLIDRSRRSCQAASSDGSVAVFDAEGATAEVTAAVATKLLAAFDEMQEIGDVGVDNTEAAAGNAATTITVPAGEYWRLIGAHHLLVTDANAANRVVVFTVRDAEAETIEAISHEIVTASTTAKRTTLFGTQAQADGDEAVAAQGTLTIAEQISATDTMTINGVELTFVAELSGAEGEILVGATEAATKVNINAAIGATPAAGAGHSVTAYQRQLMAVTAADFSSDDMVFTAVTAGTAGNAIATTETFTHGSNVFDAATLGTTTAGVDSADKMGAGIFPAQGPLLGPGEDIYVTVTNGVAGDDLDVTLFYLKYDDDPTV